MTNTGGWRPEALAAEMAAWDLDPAGLVVQIAHRMAIVERWGIAPGARVLEIGCGQGEGAAALAAAVGPDGRVVSFDPAPPEYGAPVTLGASIGRLLEGRLGERMEFHLETDPLAIEPFPADVFDEAALIHSAWYFPDSTTLERTLERVRPWARRLRIAEWDLAPDSMDQLPHLLAALVQGVVEPARPSSAANIRTPLSRGRMIEIVERAGWRVAEVADLDTVALQDGDWEIALALEDTLAALRGEELTLPPHLKSVAASLGDALTAAVGFGGRRPLPAFALTADRN